MAARNAFVFALVLLTLAPSLPAGAVTVTDLRGIHLDSLFGRYAPRGDCAREPRITVDPTGIAFTNGGRTVHTGKFEYAVSYGPYDYQGISSWFFPFVKNADDFGPVLMTFNADEKPGLLTITNQATGAASPLHAALFRNSPYSKCASMQR